MELYNVGLLLIIPIFVTLFSYHSKIKRKNKEINNSLENRKKLSIELQKRDIIHKTKRSKSALKKKEGNNKRKSVQFNEVVLEVLDSSHEDENENYNNGSMNNTPTYPKIIKSSLKSGKINTPLRKGNYNGYLSRNNENYVKKNIFPKGVISEDGYIISFSEEKLNLQNKNRNINKRVEKNHQIININDLKLTPLYENKENNVNQQQQQQSITTTTNKSMDSINQNNSTTSTNTSFVATSAIADVNTEKNDNNNNNNLINSIKTTSSTTNLISSLNSNDSFNSYKMPVKADTLPRVSISNNNSNELAIKSNSLPRPSRPKIGHRRQSSVRLTCIY